MKYSVESVIYGVGLGEPTRDNRILEKSFEKFPKLGCDGIGILWRPGFFDSKRIRELSESHELKVAAIGCYGIPPSETDLTNPDEVMRKNAIEYVKRCLDFAKDVSSPLVTSAPCYKKIRPLERFELEWEWAVQSLKEIGRYAANLGVFIAIEPVQRYHTYMVNNADQALKLVEGVQSENVKIMLDVFHMNIEEPDPPTSIRKVGGKLLHVHVAESNRQSIGEGHIDFRPIIRALKEIGYDRYLSIEAWPMVKNAGISYSGYNFPEKITEDSLDQLVQNFIKYLRFLEKVV